MRRRYNRFLDIVMKNAKIIFPVLVVALVALTVVIALNLSEAKKEKIDQLEQTVQAEDIVQEELIPVVKDVPLVLNEDAAINSLVVSYYNALALGDIETIQNITDETDDKELILIKEKSKYIDSYPVIEVYSKPGYDENSTVVYIYTKTVFKNIDTEYPGYRTYYISSRDNGMLYFKSNFSDEEADYISRVSAQDDIVELNNRVVVEYNQVMESDPKLLNYLEELTAQIEKDAGAELSKLHADVEEEVPEEEPAEEVPEEPVVEEEPEEIILYVKTTATVNVRSSDSEKADKLGKATQGSKLQVLEQRVNGWTKVLFEGKEGYIKSEYLKLQDNAANLSPIGTVEATTTVNVRSQASETADKLGALPKGTSVNLYARENGWCKIEFNSQIGYVKEDYVK